MNVYTKFLRLTLVSVAAMSCLSVASGQNISINLKDDARVVFEGTHVATTKYANGGIVTANLYGVWDRGSMRPYGFLFKKPKAPLDSYVPLYMNTSNNPNNVIDGINIYNGIIYSRLVPASDGEMVGYYSKTPISGIKNQVVLYTSGPGCPDTGDSDVVLSAHFSGKPFKNCGHNAQILGYIMPDD